jgi:o-succinylbenzoate synthase
VKIDKIILHHLKMPLVAPFETSFGRISARECIIVEAESQGLTGWGECSADRDPGYSYETTTTSWHILKDFLAPLVLAAEDVNTDIYPKITSRVRGHHLAKAGLEMALWDLTGRMAGKSLRDTLGGERDRVPVGVSVGLQESPTALVKKVEEYTNQGYQRIKIKIKPGRDVDDARAVRMAFPDLSLQVDANSAYSLENVDRLLPLDQLNLLLIEQPLAEDDLWDHSRLQLRLQTPLCLDESITTPRHARQALEMKSCQIINIKAGRLGGIEQGLQVHQICLQSEVPVWCGGMLETGIGRAANLALASLLGFTLPGDISATNRYYEKDITKERFVLNPDSTITVPTGIGLGIHVDQAALEEFRLARLEIGTS